MKAAAVSLSAYNVLVHLRNCANVMRPLQLVEDIVRDASLFGRKEADSALAELHRAGLVEDYWHDGRCHWRAK